MPANALPILGENEVRALLTYDDLIPAMRQALADYSAGRVLQPIRTIIPISQYSGWFATTPAVYGTVMGAKLVAFYPRNADLQKHTHLAMIALFRADTGEPLAIMDGRLITEMRTAAVSAVAIDLLAPPRPKVLAIFGSGVQARSHFQAVSRIRTFQEIRVWSRSPDHARQFASEIGGIVASHEQAASGADVVLTLTSSPEPVLSGRWLKNDALVCAVGSAAPDRRELDDEAMRGPVIVESREAAQREPGDILLAKAQVTAELGELLIGATFERRDRPVVFKSVGIAVEDIAAKLVYEKYGGVAHSSLVLA